MGPAPYEVPAQIAPS